MRIMNLYCLKLCCSCSETVNEAVFASWQTFLAVVQTEQSSSICQESKSIQHYLGGLEWFSLSHNVETVFVSHGVVATFWGS